MYNGIGLTTPRGSGTNGYVQRNLIFSAKPVKKPTNDYYPNLEKIKREMDRPPNDDILLHQRKRQIELECFKLREELEEKEVSEEEMEKAITELRQRLRKEMENMPLKSAKEMKEFEVHQLKEAKLRELEKFRSALGINPEVHVEGAAFDRELQEQRRMLKKQAALQPDLPLIENSAQELELIADTAKEVVLESASEAESEKHHAVKSPSPPPSQRGPDRRSERKRSFTPPRYVRNPRNSSRSPLPSSSSLRRRSPRRRSRSPPLHRSPSPVRRSPPLRRRSRSPIRRRSPSPVRRSPPLRKRSRSPLRRSPSPIRRSPVRRSSRRRSPSPVIRSPVRRSPRRRSPPPRERRRYN